MIFPKFLCALGLSVLCASAALAEPFEAAFPDLLPQIEEPYRSGLAALDLKHGKITLPEGGVTLDVPEGFYFLNAKDGRYVIETLWGNPPSPETLGMIFPSGKAPVDDTWGIEVTFDAMGYVSDEDAASMNYDDLLADLRRDLGDENAERQKQGFPTVELLGWAAKPHYDAVERKLYWAKLMHFSDNEDNTLNYNIRALGRKGVLVVNFIAAENQLPQVEAAAPNVLKMISFEEGHRYADFVPGADTVAAVGIGGLIAGKVAAKAGLLVVLLAFLKKGLVLVLLPLAWVWSKVKSKLFGRKPDEAPAKTDEDTDAS